MKRKALIFVGLLFIVGCGDSPKEVKEAKEQKPAEIVVKTTDVIKVAPPEMETEKAKEKIIPQEEPLIVKSPEVEKAPEVKVAPKEVASLVEPAKEPANPPRPKEIETPWGNAPDFTLKRIGQGEYTLSKEAKNKVVILDFFATWCGPCRMEIPGFVELYQEYKNQGLEIIGVSMDSNPPKAIPSFASKYRIDYPIVIADPAVVAAYGGIRGIPTTFIIDRKGNVVKKYVGYVAKNVFEEEIKELLK